MKIIFVVLFNAFILVACSTISTPIPTGSPTSIQTFSPVPPTLTPSPTVSWVITATPLNLSSGQNGEIVSILDQIHPYLCLRDAYNLVTLTPPPIEMHLPTLRFTEITALPAPRPRDTNERADNIDNSRTALIGCQPGNCGKLYLIDHQTDKFYEVDFGATTDRPLDWLQWINKDVVTVTQQGHLWINIVAINVRKQQFEYYGMSPGCAPIPTSYGLPNN